jgi:hypothetical protein
MRDRAGNGTLHEPTVFTFQMLFATQNIIAAILSM